MFEGVKPQQDSSVPAGAISPNVWRKTEKCAGGGMDGRMDGSLDGWIVVELVARASYL